MPGRRLVPRHRRAPVHGWWPTRFHRDLYHPAFSPVYYVTYVRVYRATPTYVYVGYTPGYYGAVVAPGGVVVYGTGYYYSPWVGRYWYGYPVTYGMGVGMAWTPWTGWASASALAGRTARCGTARRPLGGVRITVRDTTLAADDGLGPRRLGQHHGEHLRPARRLLDCAARRDRLQRVHRKPVGDALRHRLQLRDRHADHRPEGGGEKCLHRQLRLWLAGTATNTKTGAAATGGKSPSATHTPETRPPLAGSPAANRANRLAPSWALKATTEAWSPSAARRQAGIRDQGWRSLSAPATASGSRSRRRPAAAKQRPFGRQPARRRRRSCLRVVRSYPRRETTRTSTASGKRRGHGQPARRQLPEITARGRLPRRRRRWRSAALTHRGAPGTPWLQR